MHLILFGTSGCHLCEQAEVLLNVVLKHYPQVKLERIDIAEEIRWQEKYAVRIPVLLHLKSGRELGWIFDTAAVTTFINSLVDLEHESSF
jgi:hypothetical protein